MELQGKRIVVLVEEQYDDLEVWYPTLRLCEAGAEVIIVGMGAESYESKHGLPVHVDMQAEQVQIDDVDAVIVPSARAPEVFREHPAMATIVHAAIQQGKLVATTSAAGRMIAATSEEGDERARRLFEMQDDIVQDQSLLGESAVIREGNLIMARMPVDLPAFCRMIMAALAEPSAPSTPTVTYD
jgi:protease I